MWTHIKHLPRDSAFSRQMRGDSAYWDEHVELLAQTVDALNAQTFSLLTAWGATGMSKPEPTPRPGAHAPQQQAGSLADFNALAIEG